MTSGTGRGQKKNKVERRRKTFKRAYLTKAQAARRLQVTTADFERLVILKGIYPREPKRMEGGMGKDKTYFFAKDILWLEREPMLGKMREFASFSKKLTRLRGRRETFDAKLFEKQHKPEYSLATMIKERYPTFTDCLRDCDDALTHVFLYAALPPRVHSSSTIEGHTHLTSSMSDQCKELRERWLNYTKSQKCLKKTFISIKGIYYQANVQGETITWQCPYEFTSKPPTDVVYRTMINFLEFYIQQLRFILFKLEHDKAAEEERAAIAEDEGEGIDQAEDFPVTEQEAAAKESAEKRRSLLSGLKFFVSREVPKMHLAYIINSFSGEVTDDASDKTLTHYVVDRPQLAGGEKKGLLPADEYLMGKPLPPHVSPFRISISNNAEETSDLKRAMAEDRRIMLEDVPDRVHEIRRMLDPSYTAGTAALEAAESEDEDEADDRDREELDDSSAEEESVSEDSDEDRVRENIERSKQSKKKLQKQLVKGDNKPTEKEAAEGKREKLRILREKRAEEPEAAKKRRKAAEEHAKEQAAKELKMAVMQPKTRKLYAAMQHGIAKRQRTLDTLEERRQAVREGEAEVDKKTRTLKLKGGKK